MVKKLTKKSAELTSLPVEFCAIFENQQLVKEYTKNLFRVVGDVEVDTKIYHDMETPHSCQCIVAKFKTLTFDVIQLASLNDHWHRGLDTVAKEYAGLYVLDIHCNVVS